MGRIGTGTLSGLEPIACVWEPNGALVLRTDWNTFEEHYYYFDELGSTRLIVNEQGNVTDRYTYDAWGNVTAHDQYTGSIGDSQPYRYVGQLGYYAHHQDQNMDLLQLGVRFYDPEIGRFTQVDPARDGWNWYAYVEGRPTIYADPHGLIPWKNILCAIGTTIGTAIVKAPFWIGSEWILFPTPTDPCASFSGMRRRCTDWCDIGLDIDLEECGKWPFPGPILRDTGKPIDRRKARNDCETHAYEAYEQCIHRCIEWIQGIK